MLKKLIWLKKSKNRCRKDTENINPKVSGTSNGKTMILSKCALCGGKKSRFIKNQEVKGLLSNLGLKTPLSKVPILSEILFWVQAECNSIEWNSVECIKWMKWIINFY